MSYQTITESNISMRAFDQGDDVQIKLIGATVKVKERWFSRHTAKGETFAEAAKRCFEKLAGELGTTIMPIV